MDAVFEHRCELIDFPVKQPTPLDYERLESDYSVFGLDPGFLDRVRKAGKKRGRGETTPLLPLGNPRDKAREYRDRNESVRAVYGVRVAHQSKKSGFPTFIVQLACDFAADLPTEKAINGRGYSALGLDGMVGPEGGNMLVEQTLDLIDGIWRG